MANTATNDEPETLSSSCCRIGTFNGTMFFLHWSYFAVLAFNMVLAFLSVSPYAFRAMLYTLFFFGPMVFLSLVVHEMGHVIATKKLGGEVEEVILWPLGGLTFYGPTNKGYIGDLKVALAGPIMQIPLMIILAVTYVSLRPEDMSPLSAVFASYNDITGDFSRLLLILCMTTFWYNMFIFMFNVFIPIHPLDGVRIYAAVLKFFGASLTKTAKIVSFTGMFLSACTFILAIVELLFFEVYGGGIFELALGAFGLASSKALYDRIKAGRLKEDGVFGRACYESEMDSTGIEMNNNADDEQNSSNTTSVPIERTETSEIV